MAKVPQASYGIATGYNSSTVPISQPRDPTSSDVGYDVFQVWFNSSSSIFWVLTSYTSASGTVLANWQQQSGSLNGIDVDTSSGAGTNPVLPDVSGDITLTGAQVTSGTVGANVIRTNSLAASSATIQIQQSGEAAAEDTTLNGVCHFDSSHFNVSNGFVTLSGGGMAIDSLIPDSGTSPVIPNAGGQVTMAGSGSITTVGGANTLTTQLTGLTNHAVLVGAGTTTITKLAVGSTGTLLVGATGADPAFAASAEGDFDFTQSSAASATNRKLGVTNSDTTSSASNAQMVMAVGGTSSGDAHNIWSVASTRAYSLGPDTSDSQILKLTTAAASSVTPSTGTTLATITSNGFLTLPLQPAIWLRQDADILNATGATPHNFTTWTVLLNQTAGSYAAGTYTIPSTGNYFIQLQVGLTNVQVNHTDGGLYLNLNGAPVQASSAQCNMALCRSAGGALKLLFCQFFRFTAGDTVSFGVDVANGANVVTISGSGGGDITVASIFKVS